MPGLLKVETLVYLWLCIDVNEPSGRRCSERFLPHRKLKDAVDPNVILIDPTSLLNTELNNIHHEFKKLLKKLTTGPDDDDDEDLEGAERFILFFKVFPSCV